VRSEAVDTPDVRWLLQSAERVPAGDAWLSAEERAVQAALRFEARRGDWRLGRWTAKLALCGHPASPLAGLPIGQISILADDEGAPEVFRAGARQPVALSLSHRAGWALAVVAPSGVRLGCDLEVVERRSPAFVADYFTPGERRMLERAAPEERDPLANLVWSAKESALKARRCGLRVDTRSADVEVPPADFARGWSALRVRCGEDSLTGWWSRDGLRLATVVAAPASPPPAPLVSLRSPAPVFSQPSPGASPLAPARSA